MHGWIPISGESMWPALRSGDRARLIPLLGEISAGAVVVARIERTLVAHRVVGVCAGEITLRGDNCAAFERVATGSILGEVDLVQRGRRTLGQKHWDKGPRWLGRLRLHLLRRLG